MRQKIKEMNFKELAELITRLVTVVDFFVKIFQGFYRVFFVMLRFAGKKRPLLSAETGIAVSGMAIYSAVTYRDKFK